MRKLKVCVSVCIVCLLPVLPILNFYGINSGAPKIFQLSEKKLNVSFEVEKSSSSKAVCEPVSRFAFVKNHKCGTMFLTTLFLRVSMDHNWEIVLPNTSNWKIDWPNPPQNFFPSRKPNRRFDVLVLHTMYDKVIWNEIMDVGYKRISIFRSPFAQFKSYFNFFNVAHVVRKVTKKKNISEFDEFLSSPESYRKYLYSPSRNVQAYNFGYRDYFNNKQEEDFIQSLEQDFDLMLITDYMTVSLVLLKETFCWSLKDMLGKKKNDIRYFRFKNKFESPEIEKEREEKYRNWARLDYILFDKFNRTFWTKVNKIVDLETKTQSYDTVSAKISSFCDAIRKSKQNQKMVIDKSSNYWGESILVDRQFCDLSVMPTVEFVKMLKMKQGLPLKEFADAVDTSVIKLTSIEN